MEKEIFNNLRQVLDNNKTIEIYVTEPSADKVKISSPMYSCYTNINNQEIYDYSSISLVDALYALNDKLNKKSQKNRYALEEQSGFIREENQGLQKADYLSTINTANHSYNQHFVINADNKFLILKIVFINKPEKILGKCLKSDHNITDLFNISCINVENEIEKPLNTALRISNNTLNFYGDSQQYKEKQDKIASYLKKIEKIKTM